MKCRVNCLICGKEDLVFKSRKEKYKTCSTECRGKLSSIVLSNKEKLICPVCNKTFLVKPCSSNRRVYCSKICQAENYTKRYLGENNPNFKNKNTVDGYRYCYKVGKKAIHRLVAKEVLDLEELPKGYHVHHRDCDTRNNNKDNLVLLSNSDHLWLHKQYGNATLWAYSKNKVTKEELVEWSDDKTKASLLLDLTIEQQIDDFKIVKK